MAEANIQPPADPPDPIKDYNEGLKTFDAGDRANPKDPSKFAQARKSFERSAESGYAPASNMLGYMQWVHKGFDATPNDAADGLKRIENAANDGYKLARKNMAWAYRNASGAEKNEGKAKEWDEKAKTGLDDKQYAERWKVRHASINGGYGIDPTTGRPFDADLTSPVRKGFEASQTTADSKAQKPTPAHKPQHAEGKPNGAHTMHHGGARTHTAKNSRDNGQDPPGSLSADDLNAASMQVATSSAQDTAKSIADEPQAARKAALQNIANRRANNDGAYASQYDAATNKLAAQAQGNQPNYNGLKSGSGPDVKPDAPVTAGRALDGKPGTAVVSHQLPPVKPAAAAPGSA